MLAEFHALASELAYRTPDITPGAEAARRQERRAAGSSRRVARGEQLVLDELAGGG